MLVFMSVAKEIPYYLDEAKEEILPHRAIDGLVKALDELNRAAQRLTHDIHRVRHEISQLDR